MQRTLIAASLLSLLVGAVVLPAVPETRKAFCSACERIVGGMENVAEEAEPNVLKHAENICDETLGHVGDMAQECKDWVDKDFGEIMDKLENDWTPEKICQNYHLC